MKALSLFSGCGGLDLGFVRAGGEIVAAYEFDAAACEGYERVMGHSAQQADLSLIDPYTLPDADGIIGGPPCQEFSRANVKFGSSEGFKNLWPATLKIVEVKRPDWFVFENVKWLVQSRKHGDYFNELLRTFESYGYRVDYRVLNAADYGVPQTRERVFIVGRRDGKAWPFPEPTHSERATLFTQAWVSWDKALSAWLPHAVPGKLPQWILNRKRYQQLPTKAYFNTQEKRHECSDRPANKPAFTVTTESHSRVRIVTDGHVYRTDTRAMAILQTLPDVELQPHVIGNAVPSRLAQAVFSAAGF